MVGGTVPKIVELGAVASESIAIVSARAVKRTRTGDASRGQTLIGGATVIIWPGTGAPEVTRIITIVTARTVCRTRVGVTRSRQTLIGSSVVIKV